MIPFQGNHFQEIISWYFSRKSLLEEFLVFLHPICSTENVKGEEPINNPKEPIPVIVAAKVENLDFENFFVKIKYAVIKTGEKPIPIRVIPT